MFYSLFQRFLPGKPAAPRKWYPKLKSAGRVNVRRFAEEIEKRSTLTIGDIENCLKNFLDLIPVFLLLGHSVSLGDLGTLRLSVKSKGGAATLAEWEVGMIKGVKLIFTPGPILKARLREEARFELKMDKDTANDRRLSRAQAVLSDPATRSQFLQNQLAGLSPEATQELLQALNKQAAEQAKAQAAPADGSDNAPTDTPSDASTDTPAKTDSKSKK